METSSRRGDPGTNKPKKPNKPTFPKAFPIARGRAPFQLHHIPGGGIVQATTAQHTPAKSSFTADSRPVPMVGRRRVLVPKEHCLRV